MTSGPSWDIDLARSAIKLKSQTIHKCRLDDANLLMDYFQAEGSVRGAGDRGVQTAINCINQLSSVEAQAQAIRNAFETLS